MSARRKATAAARLEIDLVLETPAWEQALGRDEAALARTIEKIATAACGNAGRSILDGTEVAVVLTDDETIREINREHRGFDKPTNVLSFPMNEPDAPVFGPLLGDVIVAFETVRREAEEAGIPLDDHLCHMIVHGVLHLLGYDHETEEDAEAMEALEIKVLAQLGVPDPYAASVPE